MKKSLLSVQGLLCSKPQFLLLFTMDASFTKYSLKDIVGVRCFDIQQDVISSILAFGVRQKPPEGLSKEMMTTCTGTRNRASGSKKAHCSQIFRCIKINTYANMFKRNDI